MKGRDKGRKGGREGGEEIKKKKVLYVGSTQHGSVKV